MDKSPSRREFLKLAGLSLAALAFKPLDPALNSGKTGAKDSFNLSGRVTRGSISVYSNPDVESKRLYKIPRDTILTLREEILSPTGPADNPRWYRIEDGFVHSAYLQRVDQAHLNPVLRSVPAGGLLGEVTVPFSQSQYKNRQGDWIPLYRYYYESVHWISGIFEDPGGETWYEITDERLWIHTRVLATHLRPVPAEELTQVSPNVPDCLKRIEVSLSRQILTAYEADSAVFQAPISSGRRYMETPVGNFQVERKYPSRHMGDGGLTSSPDAYELVGVPWATFFHPAGIAFHGTYWHDNFGSPMSQGCVNMRNSDAKWLFRWCSPYFNPQPHDRSEWKRIDRGTQVDIIL